MRYWIAFVAVELPEKQGLKHYIIYVSCRQGQKLQWNFQKNKD